MSVVPMQKVRFVVHADDTDRLLKILQRTGAMEFVEVEAEETTEAKSEAPHHTLYPRVQHGVTFLNPYAAKVGLWRTLRDGVTTDLSEADIEARIQNTDAVESIVEDIERLQVEIAEVNDTVRDLEEQHAVLVDWQNLPIRLADLETAETRTMLVKRSNDAQSDAALEGTLKSGLSESGMTFALTAVDVDRVAVTVLKTAMSQSDLEKFLESLGGRIIPAPVGVETPEIEVTAVAEALAKAKGELGVLHDQAEHAAKVHLNTLQVASEVLAWESERHSTIESGRATKHTIVLDGWLNADKRVDVEAAVAEQKLAAVLQERELEEGEEPPVDIKNSPFVEPFEVVTRLYGMPGHKDLDPTLFLAGFFFLFFGLSLTDVGYGLTLMIVSIVILTMFKVAPVVRTFAKLLLFMGLGSFLVGLLFGGYLGIPAEALPEALRAIVLFDPIGNPLPVFYLALGLGVFQVMVGMFLKIYSDSRNGQLVGGILDQGPWLFVFFTAIAYLAVTTGYLSGVTEAQLINLIYVGLVMVVLASGRNGKTLMEKVQKSALSLYDSIGYFSDILSYSRLLALGLATTALAFAVNLIAEIVSGSVPYLGPVLAIVVLVIGHLFTLAVNTLGAFIHSARLQFVEFFGKFIAGTGREFKPLRRSHRYISVKDK